MNIPALCDAEVLSGLLRVVRLGLVTRSVARAALDAYSDLPVIRHAHTGLLGRAFELGTFSAYDAIYVALAERLGARLLTTDRRLARAVAATRGIRVRLA